MITELDRHLDMEALRETFLFANTPSFLYKRFRSDSSVQNLASSWPAEKLISCFQELMREKNLDADTAAKTYAVVAALSFNDTPEIRAFFENLPNTGLLWARELAQLYKGTLRQEVRYVQTPRYRNSSLVDTSAESPTTTVTIPNAGTTMTAVFTK